MVLLVATALAAWPDPPTGGSWINVRDDTVRIDCTVHEGLNWCKASAVFTAPPTQIQDVVERFDQHVRNFAHIKQFSWLDDRTAYLYIDYPNPLDDRDYLAYYSKREEGGVLYITWKSVEHAAKPPQDGVVRLVKAAGRWTVAPHPQGTRVTYEWEADIGTDIPGWILRRAAETHGNEIMEGLSLSTGSVLVDAG